MKTTIKIILVFSLLAFFACDNQPSGSRNNPNSAEKKTPSDQPVNTEKNTTKVSDFPPCESIITEILTTSPRYQQLTKGLYQAVLKNGGSSFGVGLEGSPNPDKDNAWSYSKTYDFTIYEVYPDRRLNTARFTFDPHTNQLYEYDVVNDRLTPIEFDRSLLFMVNKVCK